RVSVQALFLTGAHVRFFSDPYISKTVKDFPKRTPDSCSAPQITPWYIVLAKVWSKVDFA
ncbi:hypothetical protein, partial [Acinetobacter baumannii]|uniref:hypothetical protein n=1 Tax=Acinetobacter baumannii TaxID=470 RepID=UPI001BB46423